MVICYLTQSIRTCKLRYRYAASNELPKESALTIGAELFSSCLVCIGFHVGVSRPSKLCQQHPDCIIRCAEPGLSVGAPHPRPWHQTRVTSAYRSRALLSCWPLCYLRSLSRFMAALVLLALVLRL